MNKIEEVFEQLGTRLSRMTVSYDGKEYFVVLVMKRGQNFSGRHKSLARAAWEAGLRALEGDNG
jgi:hypothetical protein